MSDSSATALPPATALPRHGRAPRPQTLGERVLERHGGVIFSIFLHLMILSFLFRFEWRQPRPAPPTDIVRVTLGPPPPAPPPILPPTEPLIDAAAAAATQPDPTADSVLEELAKSEPVEETAELTGEQRPDARPDVLPTIVPDPVAALQREVDATLSTEQLAFLAERTQRRQHQQRQLERRQDDVVRAADKESMISKARQLNLGSSGVDKGIVRTMELKGVPDDILRRVLLKNGIEILHSELRPGDEGPSPIGSVATDEATYHAAPITRPGLYEIVRLSPHALAVIGRLELQYLRDHRLEPMKTKFISVTFGIANLGANKGYDLVILNAETRSLE